MAQAVGDGGQIDDESDIVKLKEMAEQKLIRFRTLLNKKSVQYAELITSAKILMDLNDQLIQNEEAKLKLTEEIDVSTLELLQKRETAETLQANLTALKEEYRVLKSDISALDRKAEFLKTRVKECEDEYDEIGELVKGKKLEVE